MRAVSCRIALPVDPKLLISANQRIHHHQRAKVVKHWREAARDAVPAGALVMERVHITATFRFPTKHRRDVANLYSYVIKSAIDGAVDAGLIPGDHDEVVEGLTIRRDPVNGPHSFTLTFQEI